MSSSAHIVYSSRGGVRYATVMRSVRTGKTTRKEKVLYLGRVLDAERGIYKNKARGVFSFDLKTMTCSPMPADFVDSGTRGNAGEDVAEEGIVNFGDAFLLNALVTRYGLDAAISAIQCDNPDTLKALLLYCMLSSCSLSLAPVWYEGSFARILYPGANLTLTSIGDLLATLGQEEVQQRFFKASLRILAPKFREGTNILVERFVQPGSTLFSETGIGNHGKVLCAEVRILCMLNRETQLPIFLRCVSDPAPGASEIVTTMQELQTMGPDTAFVLPDANWLAERDMQELLEKKIPFLMPCPTSSRLCWERVADHLGTLEAAANLVPDADGQLFNGRRLCMKCVPVQNSQGRNLYAYPGKDMLSASMENKLPAQRAHDKKVDRQAFHEEGMRHGVFLFLASDKMRPEELLSTWLAGQEAERILVTSLPPELQSEDTLKGHLLLNFIAETVLKLLQLDLRGSNYSLNEVLTCMANQHAKVFEKVVIPVRASHVQKAIYDLLDMHPLAKYPRH